MGSGGLPVIRRPCYSIACCVFLLLLCRFMINEALRFYGSQSTMEYEVALTA